jgi:hypothetical protein
MINKALFARCRIDEIPKVIPGQKSACRKFHKIATGNACVNFPGPTSG